MTKFDPKANLIDLRGKAYLPVNQRLVWFREDHPNGSIQTEVVCYAPVVVQARIYSVDGVLLATGHGSANVAQGKTVVWSGREIEKAETAAIGRALGHAGFGTQFDNDDDDLEHLADSPIELVGKNASESHQEGATGDLPMTERPATPKAEKSAAEKVLGNGHNRPRNLVQNAEKGAVGANSGTSWQYDLPALMAHPEIVTVYPKFETRAKVIKAIYEGGYFNDITFEGAIKLVLDVPEMLGHGKS